LTIERPKSVNILGIPYTLRYVPKGEDIYLNPDEDEEWGLRNVGSCEPLYNSLGIRDGVPVDLELITVIHESFHAGIVMSNSKDRFKGRNEEHVVDVLAITMAVALKDPAFLSYITQLVEQANNDSD